MFLSLSATLALLLLWRRNPWGILAAAMLFGGADAFRLRDQNLGVGIPYQFLVMLPYLLTIICSHRVRRQVCDPAAPGLPFQRNTK